MKKTFVKYEQIIFILFMVFYISYSAYFFYYNKAFPEFDVKLIIAVASYLFSHLLRGIRLWIIISDVRVSLLNVYLLSFIGDTIGGLINKIAGEVVKVYIYNHNITNNLWRILISLIYTRFHDLLFFFMVMTYLSINDRIFDKQISFLITAGLIIIFIIIFILPKLIDRIMEYLIKYNHSKASTWMVGILHSLKDTYSKMKINRSEIIFLIFFLTLGIWIFEFISIYLLTTQITDVVTSSSFINTMENIFSNALAII